MKIPMLPKGTGNTWDFDPMVIETMVDTLTSWAIRSYKGYWHQHHGPQLSHSGVSVRWALPDGPNGTGTMIFTLPDISAGDGPVYGWTPAQQDELRKIMIGCGIEVGRSWNGNGVPSVSFAACILDDASWKQNVEYHRLLELYGLSEWPEAIRKMFRPGPELKLEPSIDLHAAMLLQRDVAAAQNEIEVLEAQLVEAKRRRAAGTSKLRLIEAATAVPQVNDILR